jgi:hypothetical protein
MPMPGWTGLFSLPTLSFIIIGAVLDFSPKKCGSLSKEKLKKVGLDPLNCRTYWGCTTVGMGKTEIGVALLLVWRDNVEDRSISFLFLQIRSISFWMGSVSAVVYC